MRDTMRPTSQRLRPSMRHAPLAGALCLATSVFAPTQASAQAVAVDAAPPSVVNPPPVAEPVVVPAEAPPAPPVVSAAPPAPAVPPPPPAVVPAAAPVWSPVYTGSFFSRYEVRNGFDQLGASPAARPRFQDGDAVYYRARFGFNTGLMDVGNDLKVGFQFTPQASGVFGSLSNTISDVNLNLHEGYMRTQGKWVRVDAGRFELNYGDALVLGNLDWNETGRTFDGVRARVSKSPTSAWLDLFATIITEGKSQVPVNKVGDGDLYLLGAYAALGPAIMAGLDLDAYVLERLWPETDQKIRALDTATGAAASPAATYQRQGAAETTFGMRAKQKIKLFDYRVEAGLQTGSRPGGAPSVTMGTQSSTIQKSQDVLAYQGDIELGIQAVPDKLRVSLEGLYASGDDPNTKDKNEGWDELYPTAHKFLGLSDAFVRNGQKRTDVASGVLHVAINPIKNFAINLDGHVFSRPEKLTATGKTGIAGSEFDMGAAYTLAKGLKVRALYALFLPTNDFYPVGAQLGKVNPDPVHFGEVELRYDLAP